MVRTIYPDIAIKTVSALAHDTRLQAFRRLVQVGDAGMTAGELCDELGQAPATFTAHLNQLRVVGLVRDQREGREICLRAGYAEMQAFANQTVTLARSLTATFSGIRIKDVPVLIEAQLLGAIAAMLCLRWLLLVGRGSAAAWPVINSD